MATVNLGHVVGPGVPTGGTAGQVLKKVSGTNYDAAWTDVGDLPEVGAVLADIADEYSASTVYQEGDYCIYTWQLYKHNSWGGSTPAAEAWTAAHWTAVTVMDELDAEASARATADTAINTRISGLQGEIGYVVDGKQCANAVATGKYVIVKNSTITGVTDGLYTAAKAITANTDIDSTYLTAVSGGGLNSLNDQMATLNSEVTNGYRGIAYLVGTTNGSTAIPAGSFVYVNNNGNGVADGLYTANETIGAYYQITTSRVTAAPVGGGLNALNDRLEAEISLPSGYSATGDNKVYKVGKVVHFSVALTIPAWTTKTLSINGLIPNGFKPGIETNFAGIDNTNDLAITCFISSSGNLSIYRSYTTNCTSLRLGVTYLT